MAPFLLILPVPRAGSSADLSPIAAEILIRAGVSRVQRELSGIGRGHLLAINYLVLKALAWELNPRKANPLRQPPS
jgi:hypothetical protein